MPHELILSNSVQSAMISAMTIGLYEVESMTPYKVHLFTNDIEISRDSVVADFTEAAFTGYAAKDLADAEPLIGRVPGTGEWRLSLAEAASGVSFKVTVTPEEEIVIRGFFITNSGGTDLIAAGYLDEPVTLSQAEDQILLEDLVITLPPDFSVS